MGGGWREGTAVDKLMVAVMAVLTALLIGRVMTVSVRGINGGLIQRAREVMVRVC